MNREIINERRRRDAIQPAIVFSLALTMLVICGIFDVRKLGAEISQGTETTFFWIARVLCILLIPIFIFLTIAFIRQLFKPKLVFRVSEEGIYAELSNKLIYNVEYEDIEKITYKAYPQGWYMIFIHLKKPHKYLDAKQMEKVKQAKMKIPEAGDIAIPSSITKADRVVVVDLINFYIEKCKEK